MRMRVTFEAAGPVRLPIFYNHPVQAMIYSLLGDYGRDLHEGRRLPGVADPAISGAVASAVASGPSGAPEETPNSPGRRPYKFFVFSRLFFENRYEISGGSILYGGGRLRLEIASAEEELPLRFSEALFAEPREVEIGGSRLGVEEVAAVSRPRLSGDEAVVVRALSPITCRSTLYTAEGRPKPYYYDPHEPEWSGMIVANLRRKAAALWGPEAVAKVCGSGGLEGATVRPYKVSGHDLRRTRFKGTRIEAWSGLYELRLPEPLFQLALDAGLGERNSMGFGMIEVARNRPRKQGER